MLVAIIAPHNRTGDLGRAVEAAGATVVWSSSDPPAQALDAAARVAADVLALDPGTAGSDDLAPALLRFRAARPSTRIILLVPDRQPGDSLCRRAAEAGVYDILAPATPDALPDELAAALRRPPATIADAIRWLVGETDPQTSQVRKPRPTPEVREVVRTLGPRAVRIAIYTAGGGPEGTDLAVALAHALAARGPRVTARLRLPAVGAAVASDGGPARCVPAGADVLDQVDVLIDDLGEPEPSNVQAYDHRIVAWPAVPHRFANPVLQVRHAPADSALRTLMAHAIHVSWPGGLRPSAQNLFAELHDLFGDPLQVVDIAPDRLTPLLDSLAPPGTKKPGRLAFAAFAAGRVLLSFTALWAVGGLVLALAPAPLPAWLRTLFAVPFWVRLVAGF